MFGNLFGKGKKKKTYNDDEDKVFTGKELDDAYTRGYAEAKAASAKTAEKLAAAHKAELEEAKKEARSEGFEAATKSSSRSMKPSANENQKLSFTERRKSKKLRDKLLNDIEDILEKTTAGGVRGASIVKEDGKIKILEINSKDEALRLVRRAQKGEIRIIM